MRKLLLLAIVTIAFSMHSLAQTKADDIFKKLEAMPDQRNEQYDPIDLGDEFVLIYIPGANNPFQKFYMKQKAAKLPPNTLLVGGFKEMMGGMSLGAKKKHLQEVLAMRYKEGSTILLDMDSELAELLSLKGYAIVRVSKKENKVLEINDFGFDRVSFFKALEKYEQPKKEGQSND